MYGHMEAHDAIWDTTTSRARRERGVSVAREHPDADRLMAIGAAMKRDVFIASVLNRLA